MILGNPKLSSLRQDISIIGSGYAGLILGYSLQKAGFSVCIYEKESKVGGLLGTIATKYGPAEKAAHSFLASPALISLMEDLGVELVDVQNPKRYIYRSESEEDGAKVSKWLSWPLNLWETLELFLRIISSKPCFKENETVEQWACRRLGRPVFDHLLTPVLSGIYAGDPSKMLVELTFPKLKRGFFTFLIQRLGQKKSSMKAPKNGMGSVVEALRSKLKIIQECSKISLDELRAHSSVFVCTPSYEASDLVGSLEPQLASLLRNVEYIPLWSSTVFLKTSDMTREGVGVLWNSKKSGLHTRGVLFNSSAFPYRTTTANFSSVTVIGGGAGSGAETWDQSMWIEKVKRDLSEIFSREMNPVDTETFFYPRGLPHFTEPLKKLLDTKVVTEHLFFFGNYTGEISLRGMTETVWDFCALAPNRKNRS